MPQLPGRLGSTVFSRDSRQLAFVTVGQQGSTVSILSLEDSQVRLLAKFEGPRSPHLCDWSVDGHALLAHRRGEYLLIDVAQGTIHKLPFEGAHRGHAAFSPDGKWIAFDVMQGRPSGAFDIQIVNLETKQQHRLIRHEAHDRTVGWVGTEDQFYFLSSRSGAPGLWSVKLSHAEPVGPPESVIPDLGRVVTILGVSDTGTLFYARDLSVVDLYAARVDFAKALVVFAGRLEAAPGSESLQPAWSHDGRSFLYEQHTPAQQDFVSVRGAQAKETYKVAPALAWFGRPRWGPSGKIVVAGLDNAGQEGIFSVDQDGTPHLLLDDQQNEGTEPGEWSRDGAFYYNQHSDPAQGVYQLEVKTGKKKTVYVPEAGQRVTQIRLSPDQKWLALDLATGAKHRAALLNLATLKLKDIASLEDNLDVPCCRSYAWTPDSRKLLVVTHIDNMGRPSIVDIATGRVTHLPLHAIGMANPTLHPDGKRLLFQAGEGRFEVWKIDGFVKNEAAATPKDPTLPPAGSAPPK